MGGPLMVCIPVIQQNCNPVTSLVADAAEPFLKSLARIAGAAVAEEAKFLVAAWTNITPDPVGTTGSSVPLGTVADLQHATYWLTAALAVFGVLYKGARI